MVVQKNNYQIQIQILFLRIAIRISFYTSFILNIELRQRHIQVLGPL